VTIANPPGWYPEPGHSDDGPALERWWDGTEWTEYTRTAQAPAGSVGSVGPVGSGYSPGYGYPAYPGYPAHPGDVVAGGPGKPRRQRGRTVVGVIAALVVVGGVVGGVVALNGGSSSNATAAPGPSAAAPGGPGPGQQGGSGGPDGSGGGLPGGQGGGQGGFGGAGGGPGGGFGGGGLGGADGGPGGGLGGQPQPSAPSTTDPGFAVDALDGISLPVPAGWKGSTDQNGLASLTVGSYACPADTTKQCLRGGAFSLPAAAAELKATTAEAAAKEDISKNATDSYSADAYGGITSHKVLKSQQVTVAGEQGYLVRWQVVTKTGDDGYVQSLVFPSPASSAQLVVVRFGFDISSKAPKLSVMDQITSGIKVSGAAGGTGV